MTSLKDIDIGSIPIRATTAVLFSFIPGNILDVYFKNANEGVAKQNQNNLTKKQGVRAILFGI